MSIGLIALLDDIAALAKVAAASLDDIVYQAAKAGAKAAGVVIDDAAVTPRYVTGFSAARELPIIGKITLGSLKNKLLILLPAALILSLVAPQAITPLLMIGGLYLCYEGVEKVYGLVLPHAAHAHESSLETTSLDAKSLEDEKVLKRNQDGFHPVGRNHGDYARRGAVRQHVHAGPHPCRRWTGDHDHGLWRRGAYREGR